MKKALLDEKHEFVSLFIDHGVVDLKDYFNEERLLNLYKENEEVGQLAYV